MHLSLSPSIGMDLRYGYYDPILKVHWYLFDRVGPRLADLHCFLDPSDLPMGFRHRKFWEGVKFPMSESHWNIRGIKEAVQIRKSGPYAMNQDGGRHQLPDVYLAC